MIKREYWSNGQLRYEYPYNKGQLHGIIKYWYDNGQLNSKFTYYQGQLHGVTEHWWPSGKFDYKIYFLYGDEVTQKEYRKHELVEKLSGL